MATCNLAARLSVTGDCSNTSSGAFTINILGSNPPFYYQLITPLGPLTPLTPGVTSFTQTNLAGTYTYLIQDSCAGNPTQTYVNVVISDGVCASLLGYDDTTCNLPNGVITAQTDNNLSGTNYSLYENTIGFITSGESSSDKFIFSNLSAGTYYVIVNDGGGCTGKTETCIVKPSSELDFGFYIINDTGCESIPGGKIYVTGMTGHYPYVYQWSTGALTSSISGLTPGTYQLTLTDATGCQVTKLATVNAVPPVGVANYIPVQPSCSSNDGEITIVITGGTPPYNYVASNGESLITFSQTFSLTGLSSGVYTISVTDAGLCTTTNQYSLTPPNGFSIINVGIVNSTCNNSSGALSPITLNGGTPPFTYDLTYPSGNSSQYQSFGNSFSIQGLSAGTYTLSISNGACIFTNTYTINNTEKFTFSTNVTGSTCDTNNGSVQIILSTGGTPTYTYQFQGQPTITNTSQTAVTFNNLFAGTYLVSVSDYTNCTQTQTIVVPDTPSIDFTLVGTDSLNGNNGQIQTYITEGPPPYTISWSSNANGQTGLTVTNLSAGTYSLLITDGNGCQLSREITIYGYNNYGTYGVFDYCESTLEYNGVVIPKKIPQMYLEGYSDLIVDEINCVLNEATFYSQVSLAGVSAETAFYTSDSLGDYPSDNQWFDAIRDSLLSFPVIGNVIILPDENKITIQTNCSDLSLSLDNSQVTVALKIVYDISCACKLQPGPIINLCDKLYIQPPNQLYQYVHNVNTSNLLTINDYTYNGESITFTSSKLWINSVGVGTSSIQEYNITLNGFTATLNRTFNLGFEMGGAIGSRNNTTLVTTDVSTQTSYNAKYNPSGSIIGYFPYFIELNISSNTPVITNKSLLRENRNILGSLAFNTMNTQMISLQIDNTDAPLGIEFYIVVHDTINYTQLIESNITASIAGLPSGLFVDGGNVYLVDDNASIYQVGLTYPYTLTFADTIGGAGSPESISQNTECFNQEFSLCEVSCGDTVQVETTSGSKDGIFETYVNVGSGVGLVQIEFTYQSSDVFVPIRYQIEWNGNIVADSLFVYDTFNSIDTVKSVTGTTLINGTISPSYIDKYLYCFGNGNATSLGGSNSNWLTNSFKNGGAIGTINDIASSDPTVLRSTGTPGQIGVNNSYPTPASPSHTPNLILEFTKFSATPNIIKVICTTKTKMAFTFEIIQCP